jgi:PDZ domain
MFKDSRVFAIVAMIMAALGCAPAEAQSDDSDHVRRLHQQVVEAFARTDYARAEEHLNELVRLDGENFVVFYNLACARAMQDDVDGTIRELAKAIALGFSDLGQLQADPNLALIREDERYKTLIDRWDQIVALQAKQRPEKIRRGFEGYNSSRDEALKLTYLSSFDEVTTDVVKDELAGLADWAVANLFTGLGEANEADAWVTIVLPTQEDFAKWRFKRYGGAGLTDTRQIGGSYLHDEKMLITLDLGGSLRHEFFHVLHWRSMTRLRQYHPMWIQEGIGSLIEDTDPVAGLGDVGSMTPVPSWRTNIVRKLAIGGRLKKLEDLAAMSPDRFANRNPLANYAQSRGFMLFLVDNGVLGDWYRAYTAGFAADPTGLDAAMEVLGIPSLRELNIAYRLWARELPQVPEQLRPPPVRLGFETARTSGDGMIVTGFYSNGPRRAGLRLGDVITSLNGKPVRDINELLRRLGGKRAGESVTLGVRRRTAHDEVRIVLEARQ